MAINQAVLNELNEAITKLNRVAENARKEVQADLTAASSILVSAVKGRAPVSDKAHSRYSTAKVTNKVRAPKGSGRVVATYQPGNLQKSFRTLKFRRSQAVFVGPKAGGAGPDGYYAHWPEFGTVNQRGQGYVKNAVDASGRVTAEFAAKLLKKRIERYAAQNGVK